jgi:hypothetical protein
MATMTKREVALQISRSPPPPCIAYTVLSHKQDVFLLDIHPISLPVHHVIHKRGPDKTSPIRLITRVH